MWCEYYLIDLHFVIKFSSDLPDSEMIYETFFKKSLNNTEHVLLQVFKS